MDIIIADLEDSASSAEKPDARTNLLAWLNTPLNETTPQLAVRINPVSTRFGLDDLAASRWTPRVCPILSCCRKLNRRTG